MLHTFRILPLSIIPDWTKVNMPLFWSGRFSNNNEFLIIDNAHTDEVYEAWLGPNKGALPFIKENSEVVTKDEFIRRCAEPGSIWITPQGELE